MSNNKQSSMDKEFAPYKEALALKELGFDECYFAIYYIDKQLHMTASYQNHLAFRGWVAAPTLPPAFRWFREKFNFLHHISWVYKKTGDIEWFFDIKGINMSNNNILPHSETRFESYEEAELACLRKLIEIVKEKNNEQQ